ncbi:MAG TPA: hypothetical protein VM012_14545 [Flavitalea sp.]|nr:hypothetical protein [Flavitalea sp.]
MIKKLFFTLLCCPLIIIAQDGNLKKLETSLKEKKITVESILTNPSYEYLHPDNNFRELIRNFAASGKLEYTTALEAGKKITIEVTVVNKSGHPVPNILVYFYQTDDRGWYAADAPHVTGMEGDRKHARLFGYIKTDKDGRFILNTIQPRGYPQSTLPAHIHIEIVDQHYQPVISEFLFADDPRMTAETKASATRDHFQIAEEKNGKYEYRLVLERL